MENLGDEWSSDAITTTLKIIFEGKGPVFPSQGKLYSELCGLGWRFGIYARNEMINDDNGQPMHVKRSLRLKFDPHFIDMDRFGPLTICTKSKSQATKKREYVNRQERVTSPDEGQRSCLLATYLQSEAMASPILSITVSFPPSVRIPRQVAVPSMEGLLNDLQDGGGSIDTKFYLFSRRLISSGNIVEPRALPAHSHILKDSLSYLDTLLSENGFSESLLCDIDDDFPLHEQPNTQEYDYESDSDLSDISDTLPNFSAPSSPSGTSKIDAAGCSLSPTSPDRAVAGTQGNGEEGSGKTSDNAHNASGSALTTKGHPPRMGRIVFVKDTAFKTWRALLFYLYTGNIQFRPLKSKPSEFSVGICDSLAVDPEACSPKSMYRLADKIGCEDLKRLAFAAICSEISDSNVVGELFSKFTSRYREVENMELEVLWKYINSPHVAQKIPALMRRVVEGELPHVSRLLIAFYEKLRQAMPLQSEWLDVPQETKPNSIPLKRNRRGLRHSSLDNTDDEY